MPDKWTEVKLSDSFKGKIQSSIRDLNLIIKNEKYEFEEKDNGVKKKRIGWWYELNELVDNPFLLYHHLFIPGDEKDNKKEYLKNFVKQYEKVKYKMGYESLYQRFISLLNNYETIGYKVEKSLNLQTDWRLIVGLGGESALETSICLHPLYGFPYIPGNAVKGIAKAASILLNEALNQLLLPLVESCLEYSELSEIDEINNNKIKKELAYKFEKVRKEPTDEEIDIIKKSKNELLLIRNIFGNQSHVGSVVFFDAIPYEELPELELDIMNNHYTEYYETGKTPGDWISPVPIFFVTIKPQQKFSFFLASKDRDGTLLIKAKEWLEEGLKNLGAGGKTSAGYGYFVPINNSIIENISAAKSKIKTSSSFKEAEILDANSKPPKVKILETGEVVDIGGVSLKGLGLTKGSKIFVEPTYAKKSKKIQSVKYKGKPN